MLSTTLVLVACTHPLVLLFARIFGKKFKTISLHAKFYFSQCACDVCVTRAGGGRGGSHSYLDGFIQDSSKGGAVETGCSDLYAVVH